MKRKNILTAIAGSCLVLGGLTSCEDFLTLYPTNQITEEQFWEDKGDVESGMMACYVQMTRQGRRFCIGVRGVQITASCRIRVTPRLST